MGHHALGFVLWCCTLICGVAFLDAAFAEVVIFKECFSCFHVHVQKLGAVSQEMDLLVTSCTFPCAFACSCICSQESSRTCSVCSWGIRSSLIVPIFVPIHWVTFGLPFSFLMPLVPLKFIFSSVLLLILVLVIYLDFLLQSNVFAKEVCEVLCIFLTLWHFVCFTH